MGLRYRKSIKLGKGTRLNISKSGIGISTGDKGFRVSHSSSGRSRVTASIPGTGVSYSKEIGSSGGNSASGGYSGGSGGNFGSDKPPFFQRTWVLVLSMLFFPPLAIYLMWRYRPNWMGAAKIALTVMLVAYTAILATRPAGTSGAQKGAAPPASALETPVTSDVPDKSADDAPAETSDLPQSTEDPVVDPTQEPDPEPTQAPEPEPTLDPEPVPTQEEPASTPTTDDPQEEIVYITNTGSKYHKSWCRTLKDSKIEISLSSAVAQGYEPCGVCGG